MPGDPCSLGPGQKSSYGYESLLRSVDWVGSKWLYYNYNTTTFTTSINTTTTATTVPRRLGAAAAAAAPHHAATAIHGQEMYRYQMLHPQAAHKNT